MNKSFIKEDTIIEEKELGVTDLKKKLTDGNLLVTKQSLNNNIDISIGAILKDVKIVLNGNNNTLKIEEGVLLNDCSIYMSGDENNVYIGKDCKLRGTYLMCIDDKNSIVISDKTTTNGEFWGSVYFHTMEGTSISLGSDCMLSGNIIIRTTDGHAIINKDGKRLNVPKNIVIGNHVWIGMNNILLKGSNIKDGCIIGAGSVVAKEFYNPYSVIVGNPARELDSKEAFDWKRSRGFDFSSSDFRNM